MSKYKKKSVISSRVTEIPTSGIRRFFDLIASSDNIISLGVGEPDFITPWHIRESAIYSIERGHTHYTSNNGIPELRRELSKYLEQRQGITYDWNSEILVTVGVSEALDLVMRTLLDNDDEVISTEPSFVAYQPVVYMAGGSFVPIPTSMDNEFIIQIKDLERSITPKTKILLINNPNNPTGSVISNDILVEISKIVEKNDLIVVSDEIYDRLTYSENKPGIHFASLPGMKERTVTLNGFSKTFAMTGWRIGYATGPAEIISAMTKVHQYTMMSASTVSQEAAIEALKNGENSFQNMLKDYRLRKRLLVDGLREAGLDCVDPDGAFYVFPSIQSTGLTSEEFAEMLLVEEKVAVVPGNVFGPSGEGYIRCCYAANIDDIREAILRIKRFLKNHR